MDYVLQTSVSENQRQTVAYLIHMYVVVVRGVVDGFEEALKLARRSPVDHQDKRYSHWFRWRALSRVLIPLDIHIGFTCARIKTECLHVPISLLQLIHISLHGAFINY